MRFVTKGVQQIKVLLVNPPITISLKDYFESISFMPPLGLAYIAAALSREGHRVSIVDCLGLCPLPVEKRGDLVRCGIADTEILEQVKGFAPDLVGISCAYTANVGDAISAAELIKQGYRESVPLVMGGAHASTCPEDLLVNPLVDFVAVGEGEGVMTDLCRAVESGYPVSQIKGLLTLGPDGRVMGNPERPRIEHIDAIPFPRRDLLPMEEYFKSQEFTRRNINNMRFPKTTMITSRGCPENCVFCAVRCTWGRKWVGRSPENVVEEIELLVDGYGIREIDFLDDSISVSSKRLRALCELITKCGIDIKWTTPNGIAIWSLDEELLRLMKKAGCYRLTFGLESGDPGTLAFIRKRYNHEDARRVIKFANRIGMWTIGTFIIGFPYETREQIENTIRFAMESHLDLAVFYCATPFPGTDLMEICHKEGIEVTDSASLMIGGVSSLHFSAGEIIGMREEANRRFIKSLLRKPWKALGKIRSFEDLKYVFRVSGYGLGLLRSSTEGHSTTSYLYSVKE